VPELVLEHSSTDVAIAAAGGGAPAAESILTDTSERRAHIRHPHGELAWVRAARLQSGHEVVLLDLSRGGARLSSPVPLGPDSQSTLEIITPHGGTSVPFRVIRCEVGGLTAEGIRYRGATEFVRPLDLPHLAAAARARQATPSPDLLQLATALKQLVARACAKTAVERLTAAQVHRILRALLARASKHQVDTMARRLLSLVALTALTIERHGSLLTVIEIFQAQLRRMVPHVRVRIVGGPERCAPGMRETLVGVPDTTVAGPLVSIDLPRDAALTPAQSEVLKGTSCLLMLLQRLEPGSLIDASPVLSPPASPAPAAAAPAGDAAIASPSAAREPEPAPAPATQPPTPVPAAAWQMVVVRYTDGRTLKGHTHDFLASRPHFSLRDAPSLTAADVVIVPLVRLKAVFFVRDFAGNPEYVERTDIAPALPGRRIEVTLNDDEVIVGTTMNYSFDGQGFYVTPIDPLTNNIRVFIVSNSVKQVRFPTA
jgi:hypothetical protein